MIRTPFIRARHPRIVGACLATLALTLAACSGANPTPSPSANPTANPTASPSTNPTASPTASPPAGPTASQPQTIHVIEHATNVSQVRVGSLSGCSNTTSCQGDYMVGDDPLWDAVTGQVGTLAFECFIVTTGDTLYHCPGITITLTGRGQIVFTEFYWDGVTRPETSPITGGTGEFLGATGTVTSQRGGDFVITITK